MMMIDPMIHLMIFSDISDKKNISDDVMLLMMMMMMIDCRLTLHPGHCGLWAGDSQWGWTESGTSQQTRQIHRRHPGVIFWQCQSRNHR